MSITFNEGALHRLLESADGPVGQKVDEWGHELLENVRERAGEVIKHQITEDNDNLFDYDLQENPLRAVVSTIITGAKGHRGAYLNRKALERGWIVLAVSDFAADFAERG